MSAREEDDDYDVDGEKEGIIRANWTLDGATTLTEAANQLRELANCIDELDRKGWELDGPGEDNHAFISHRG